MKKFTITLTVVVLTAFACKKEKGQKCYWSAMNGSQTVTSWYQDRPTADQKKQAEQSCSCTVTIEEHCVSCDVALTGPGGQDVPCR